MRTFPTKPRAGARAVIAAALALLAASVAAPPLQAQSPERPVHSQRHLAVGSVGFLHTWDPTIQGGYLYQISFRPSRISVDDLGVTTVTPPRWYAHALLAGGVATDSDGTGDTGLAGMAQLGVLYRFDGPMSISRAGLAGVRSWGPDGWGPVARVGLMSGNAAVSVGWMAFDGSRGDGVVVSLDLLRCILQDLGLVSACVIP